MHADDNSFMYASEYTDVINESINKDLYKLSPWLQTNKLYLNVAKTQCLVIGSRKQHKDRSDGRVAHSFYK